MKNVYGQESEEKPSNQPEMVDLHAPKEPKLTYQDVRDFVNCYMLWPEKLNVKFSSMEYASHINTWMTGYWLFTKAESERGVPKNLNDYTQFSMLVNYFSVIGSGLLNRNPITKIDLGYINLFGFTIDNFKSSVTIMTEKDKLHNKQEEPTDE